VLWRPVTLQPALRRGDATRSSAFFAGLQVPAQCVLHSGTNDCVEIRVPPPAAFALLGGAIAEANDEPVSLIDVFPEATGILLEQPAYDKYVAASIRCSGSVSGTRIRRVETAHSS